MTMLEEPLPDSGKYPAPLCPIQPSTLPPFARFRQVPCPPCPIQASTLPPCPIQASTLPPLPDSGKYPAPLARFRQVPCPPLPDSGKYPAPPCPIQASTLPPLADSGKYPTPLAGSGSTSNRGSPLRKVSSSRWTFPSEDVRRNRLCLAASEPSTSSSDMPYAQQAHSCCHSCHFPPLL
jgi:hypothetical protein